MEEVYKRILVIFEKITFKQCFFFWILFMFLFGILYYAISAVPQHAIQDKNKMLATGINGFAAAEYFSFITALSVGYGDITPIGISRLLSVLEATMGMLFIGILVSKLVSVKQELILEEIYDISFDEKLNRLRSGLYLFRADANKIIDRSHLKQISRRQVQDLWLVTVTLDTNLHDTYKVLIQKKDNRYIKTLAPLKLELLFNSIELSLLKLHELLETLSTNNLEWRTSLTMESINSIINTTELVYGYYKNKNLEDIKIIQKLDAIRVVTNNIREKIAMANAHIAQQLDLKNFEEK